MIGVERCPMAQFFFGYTYPLMIKNLSFLLNDLGLYFPPAGHPDFIFTVHAVEQEDRDRAWRIQHVNLSRKLN